MKCIFFALLVSAVAAYPTKETRGILDGVINGVLEGLRDNLTDLVLPDFTIDLNETAIVLLLGTGNMTVENLETFNTTSLETTLLPLRLDNLTLEWDAVSVKGHYDLSAILDIDVLQGPVDIYGLGEASFDLYNVTLGASASFTAKDGHIQIKELTTVEVQLGGSTVTLENFMGGGDLETVFNTFLSFFLTEFVHDFSEPLIEALKPNITELLNEILADIDFPMLLD